MEKEVNDLLKEKFLDQNKFTTDVEQLVLDTEASIILKQSLVIAKRIILSLSQLGN